MRNALAVSILFGAVVSLPGCGTAEIKDWTKSGASDSQKSQDMDECKYEAAKATAGGKAPKTTKDAVDDGVARGMEEADLIKQCMKLRGYAP